jgi:hypothetical protein
MSADLITLAWLAGYLPFVFLLHSIWYRLKPSLRTAPAQGLAFKLAFAVAMLFLVSIGVVLWNDPECLSHVAFSFLALGCLGSFYFLFICLSESGRRYFLLTLLARASAPLTRKDLAAQYSKDYIIDVRLGRLLAWGAIEEVNGRLFLKKRSFYLYCSFFHNWAQLLGYRWLEKSCEGVIK